jgi:hypothetical protein
MRASVSTCLKMHNSAPSTLIHKCVCMHVYAHRKCAQSIEKNSEKKASLDQHKPNFLFENQGQLGPTQADACFLVTGNLVCVPTYIYTYVCVHIYIHTYWGVIHRQLACISSQVCSVRLKSRWITSCGLLCAPSISCFEKCISLRKQRLHVSYMSAPI